MRRRRLTPSQRIDYIYSLIVYTSGVYLDEIAYDRVTIMRTKAVLGDTKLIDHHCDIGDMGGNSVRVTLVPS